MWEHLIPQESLIEADSLESDTPSTAPLPPLGMLVSRKSLRSSCTIPSLTELILANASPAVLNGKKSDEIYNLIKFRHIIDTFFHLGEKCGYFLKFLKPE